MIPEPRINIEKSNMKVFDQAGSLLLESSEYKFENFYQFGKWNDQLAFIPTYRDRLRDLLLEDIDVQWGKKCIEYDEDEEGVWAIFEDGSKVRGDFLIGADGINSPNKYLSIFDFLLFNIFFNFCQLETRILFIFLYP